MLDILIFNKYEAVLFLGAVLLLVLHYRNAGYNKKELLVCTVLLVPILYFSINMVTEVVTADEAQYEECITDIRNLKEYGAATKMLFEYKFSQLTIGSIFWLIPQGVREKLGNNNIWMIYKCLHWLLMYVISLVVMTIWRKDILSIDNQKKQNRLAENLVLVTLIGMPLTCLLMKVTNYDAGSTYPAILGISMMWAAFNKDDQKLGFWATIVVALGVLDKWTALLYWMIAVVLFCFLIGKDGKNWAEKFLHICKGAVLAWGGAILLSIAYFIYAGFQQSGFCAKVDAGVVVFSFVHAVKAIMTGDMSVNSAPMDIMYVPVLLSAIVIAALMIFIVCELANAIKRDAADILFKIDGIILSAGIIGGLIGAYFIPLRISPFLPIESGRYESTDAFTGWTYHFGARTAAGHFIAKICYEWATITVNYPTVVLLLIILISIVMMKKRHGKKLLMCSLVLASGIALLMLYAIAGMPSDARYYSYPILIMVLTAIYLWHEYRPNVLYGRQLLCASYALYIIEMCIFIPNVKSFSPMWLWHEKNHNQEVRTGKWYAGEIMFWGDHVAIAGNIIEAIEEKTHCDEIIIYSDYVSTWPGNPGYTLTSLNDKQQDELRYDENAYYIINKFSIFRRETPQYIYDVDPVATISYKGEPGAWIYRGDQLRMYSDEILGK